MKELEKKLNEIGWEIKGKYPNSFIFNEKGERMDFRVMSDRIEVIGTKDVPVCFYKKGSKASFIGDEKDTVAWGTKNCFILFMNHSKKPCNQPTNK